LSPVKMSRWRGKSKEDQMIGFLFGYDSFSPL
jgi:hypothetical protein